MLKEDPLYWIRYKRINVSVSLRFSNYLFIHLTCFFFSFLSVFELLKEGEVLVVPTDNPMSEKEAWLAFRDVVHGLEYRKD